MKFNRSPRRKNQTRTNPPQKPPAGQPNPAQPPPYVPPAYPGGVPPTLPGRPPAQPGPYDDPRYAGYPRPGYPQPPYPDQEPPAGTPPAYPGFPGYPPQPPAQPQYPGYPGYPPEPGYPAQQPPPPPVYHPVQPAPTDRRRPQRRQKPRRRLRFRPGCVLVLGLLALLLIPLGVYFLAPIRTNLMVIGIDYVDPATYSAVARSDTIMMATIQPAKPYVGVISVPRDLWVTIPGVGENRINTAHFFAEGARPGTGPELLAKTIAQNFGVLLPYYVRIRFEGFREIVDAMGGVDITLTEEMAGYPPGRYHLTGRKALAFVRDRSGTDDFYRMGQGQFMVKAMMKNMLNPLKWPRIPAIYRAFLNSVTTNIPAWMWPRLGLALLRVGPSGIDSHIINREMVTPFTTTDGAAVLLPNWPPIRALVQQVFG